MFDEYIVPEEYGSILVSCTSRSDSCANYTDPVAITTSCIYPQSNFIFGLVDSAPELLCLMTQSKLSCVHKIPF